MSEVSIDGVGKVYTAGSSTVNALEPVSLTLASGEFFSLVGPSGCGKSTLLSVVAGLLSPSTGTVRINGRQVRGPDRGVGIVFQKPTLLGWLTVFQNVTLPSRIAGTFGEEHRRRAHELLELAGVGEFSERYPNELSGGMQQRVAIVRALVANPEVLLMDEPFSALDEFTRELLNDELLRLWSERATTVIFVTHNIAEAVYLSDRVGVMTSRPGRLRELVPVEITRPRHGEQRSDPVFYQLVDHIRTSIANGTISKARTL